MIAAYKISAEIINAYDDSIESVTSGVIEIQKCGACDMATVTAVVCGYAAQVSGEAFGFKDLDIMVQDAVFEAAIASRANSGCQLGRISYTNEIPNAYQGMALDYL